MLYAVLVYKSISDGFIYFYIGVNLISKCDELIVCICSKFFNQPEAKSDDEDDLGSLKEFINDGTISTCSWSQSSVSVIIDFHFLSILFEINYVSE